MFIYVYELYIHNLSFNTCSMVFMGPVIDNYESLQLHLHRGGQSRLALPHLQVEQSPLQQHLISSLQAVGTSGSIIQICSQDPGSLVHP